MYWSKARLNNDLLAKKRDRVHIPIRNVAKLSKCSKCVIEIIQCQVVFPVLCAFLKTMGKYNAVLTIDNNAYVRTQLTNPSIEYCGCNNRKKLQG